MMVQPSCGRWRAACPAAEQASEEAELAVIGHEYRRASPSQLAWSFGPTNSVCVCGRAAARRELLCRRRGAS